MGQGEAEGGMIFIIIRGKIHQERHQTTAQKLKKCHHKRTYKIIITDVFNHNQFYAREEGGEGRMALLQWSALRKRVIK